MMSWTMLGFCATTFLGTVPVSASQHRNGASRNNDFSSPVDARPKARNIGESTTGVHDAFDYIIVGGGTAGNALATRLSQGLPSASILVIEAGSYVTDNLDINVPGLRNQLLGTKYDWNFTSLPIEVLNNRTMNVARGKVVGGCSAHNGLIWNRAAVAEYDAWEELGNPGWNWEALHAAMTKSENYTDGPSGSGTSGPIHAVRNRLHSPLLDLWESSFENVSSIWGNNNSNQGSPIGISLGGPNSIDPTHYNASYSTNGYLPQAGPNLTILPDTTVAKINLQRTGSNESLHHATGVTLLDGTVIAASQEVILSAGVIQSPQLLELSGIGQPGILHAAAIKPIIDLPGVGENYQDHTGVTISYQLRDDVDYTTTDLLITNATFAADELAKWFSGQTSLYDAWGGVGFGLADWTGLVGAHKAAQLQALAANASGPGADAVTRKKLDFLADSSVPQAEIVLVAGYSGSNGYPAEGTALYGKRFFALQGAVEHPLSRGSVHVNTSGPLPPPLPLLNSINKPPVIDAGFFSNPYDRAAAVAIARALRGIAAAGPLRSAWADEYEPGIAAVPEGATDEEWWQGHVARAAASSWHPTGTCSMLPRADGGVVGPDLRVYGTDNLRVVDGSVMPVEVSAHPQTVTYGIAEMAAEMVIADA